MKTKKKLGIWMDHSSAHLIEFSDSSFEVETIESKFTHQEKEKSLAKGESHLHHKEQKFYLIFLKK